MGTRRFGTGFGRDRRPSGYGPRRGRRGLSAGGPWPYLAAAFFARAAFRRARGHGGPGGPGRGPWGRDEGYASHGHEGPGKGAPWSGGWRREGAHRQDRPAAPDLRSEVGTLVALLRDAFRRGALDTDRVNEIRTVLGETRRRVAAILAQKPPHTMV